MREKKAYATTAALLVFWMAGSLHSQNAQYVHPPPPPQAADFPQPPNDAQFHWRGPVIGAVNVKCWYAEPSAPWAMHQ